MARIQNDGLSRQLQDLLYTSLARAEQYFEDHGTAHVIARLFVVAVSTLAVVLDLRGILGESWSQTHTIILLLVLVIFLVVLDFGHVVLAKNRLRQLETAKRQSINLKRMVRDASNLQLANYNIKEWELVHDINPNGDVKYQRTMIYKYLNEPVYWARARIGVIDGHPVDAIEGMGIKVFNPSDGESLEWIPIREAPDKKVLAIVLDPPVAPEVNSGFSLQCIWPGSYVNLTTELQDQGRITVDQFTERFILQIIAPDGYQFTLLRPRFNWGTVELSSQADGRSVIKLSGDDISPGIYSYRIFARRDN